MPSINEQKMGVLLGVRARKLGIASIVIMLIFGWTGIGGIISIICGMIGFRNAKIAKALAPDSPVVQSAYMINNILRWIGTIICIPFFISAIVRAVLTLLEIITL